MDVTQGYGRDRCERKNQIGWYKAISPHNLKNFTPSDALTKDVVNTKQHQKSINLLLRTQSSKKWLDVTKL